MRQDDFSDAVLIVFGHGSTVNDQSSAAVFQHAAELRRRRIFRDVLEGFWKQQPALTRLFDEVSGERVFLAPLFISEGYFSEGVIPAKLGFRFQDEKVFDRVLIRERQTFFYCRAIGSHSNMTKVILRRAEEVISKFPFPRAPSPAELTLFIAGHGTEQVANSRVAIEAQVERIRAQNLYAAVHGVFLEEEPRVPECYRLSKTKNIVVVPFFISDGMHVQEDIPILLGEAERIVRQRITTGAAPWRNPTERNGKLLWYSPSVGTDPRVADVILDRVREAAAWSVPK